MAGIGFQLRKILRAETFAGAIRAYGYAAIVSSGPWLLSIGVLAGLGIVLAGSAAESVRSLFFVSVTHVIAFSLILTGPLQLILTRYASDQLFLNRRNDVYSSFLSALLLVSFATLIPGILLFGVFGFGGIIERISTIFLFVLISNIWIASCFATALKDFRNLVLSYAAGYAASFFCAIWFSAKWGEEWIMPGMVTGQLLLFFLLLRAIRHEIGGDRVLNVAFLRYFRSHPALALFGLFYNLALWVDKFLYWWFSPVNDHLGGIYYVCPVYDIAVYLSFLSIAPGMAVFLIKLETDFAFAMEGLSRRIIHGAPLRSLEQQNDRLVVAIREGLALELKLQLPVTIALIIASPIIAQFLGINALQSGVFAVTLLGVASLVLLLSLLTVLFYMECLWTAFFCCLLFFCLNASVTWINIQQGESWYGVGLAVSGIASTLFALWAVNRYLYNFVHRLYTRDAVEV